MEKIHVLGNKFTTFHRHIHPLKVFKHELRESGIEIKFFSDPFSRGIEDCKKLLIFEGDFESLLKLENKTRDERIALLQSYLGKFEKVIWFDDRGTSGWLRTYVFPFVDIYVKAQILKNKEYYTETHLTGTLHRDYVNEQYHVEDKKLFKGAISFSDLNKIKVGWNTAMINWPYFIEENPIRNRIKKIIRNYHIDYVEPDLRQRNTISLRGNLWQNEPTVHWWRNNTLEKTKKIVDNNEKFTMTEPNKVGKRQYYEELANSLVTPSPFGIGEVCYRDFECFFSGSLLFKASMDDFVTWPDLYIDGETYISHAWDFSDFEEKMEDILAHPEHYESVAREGQSKIDEVLSDGFGFVQHFKEIIE